MNLPYSSTTFILKLEIKMPIKMDLWMVTFQTNLFGISLIFKKEKQQQKKPRDLDLTQSFLLSLLHIFYYLITNMARQPPPNAYIPGKTHTYYPIQPQKKLNVEPVPLPPQQNLRVQKVRERQIDTLRRAYEELKEREQIYIDKLMKLQQGLQNQHSQFVKLQELYTELFESYKQKQSEIQQLQMKYRESDRYRETDRFRQQERQQDRARESFRFNQSRAKQEYSFREKEWSSKEEQWQKKERLWTNKEKEWNEKERQLSDYIQNLKKKISALTQNYERVVQQFSIYKGKERINGVKPLSEKTMNQIQEWQKQVDNQRQIRLKFQYENEFLKKRNSDLEGQRQQLEKLLAYKQKQINKLREEKIKIYRQSSQKSIQRSPASKTHKKLPIKISEEAETQNNQQIVTDLAQSVANASMNSQKQKYFSFSREKNDSSIDSELPSFPAQLEIDSLISQHKK